MTAFRGTSCFESRLFPTQLVMNKTVSLFASKSNMLLKYILLRTHGLRGTIGGDRSRANLKINLELAPNSLNPIMTANSSCTRKSNEWQLWIWCAILWLSFFEFWRGTHSQLTCGMESYRGDTGNVPTNTRQSHPTRSPVVPVNYCPVEHLLPGL